MAFTQTSSKRYGRFYRSARKYAARREVLISAYLILSLFTISFFALVFIRPTAVTIAKLWREIQDKKTVQVQLEKKIRDLAQAQNLYISIEDDLVYLKRALPEKPDFSRFVKEIEYLASSHGLQFATASYGDMELYSSDLATPSATQLSKYSFILTIHGLYSQLRSFLADLEKLDRIVTLHSVAISPSKRKEEIEIFELTLTFDSSMYSYSEGYSLY